MATTVINRIEKFGLMNTFNPYKNSLSLRNVSNQRFKIDNKATYADTNVIAVTTGLIPNYEAFLNGGLTFNILNPTTQAVESILQPKIVDLGSGIVPMPNEIHWFDVVGMQGDFYVNSQWAGYILELGGNIETCSVTAEDINGINNNIGTINNNIGTINNNIGTINNNIGTIKQLIAGSFSKGNSFFRSSSSSNSSTGNDSSSVGCDNGATINVPSMFFGGIHYNFNTSGGGKGIQKACISFNGNGFISYSSYTGLLVCQGDAMSSSRGWIPLVTGSATTVRPGVATQARSDSQDNWVTVSARLEITVSGFVIKELVV